MSQVQPQRNRRPAGQTGRISDIEVLRAAAVIFVIVHHSYGSLFTWNSKSFDLFNKYFNLSSGVNIFFAISGFVIARNILPLLIAAESTRRFAEISWSFWQRRAWRLLPSAWLWLVLIQVAVLAFNHSGAFGTPGANFGAMEAGMLNLANIRFADTFGNREYGVSFPYWSLSLEEQFYFVLPIITFIFRRFLTYFIILAIIIQWEIPPFYYRLLMNTIRTDGLFFGVLIAIWSTHKSYRLAEPTILQKNRFGAMLITAILLISVAAVAAGDLGVFTLSPAPVTIVCTILVFVASFDRDYILPPGALKRVMLWIGSRSYALYLIHIPAFCLTREIWHRIEPAAVIDGTFTARYALTALPILLGLSELNYRLVEQPLRIRGAEIARRREGSAAAAAKGMRSGHWLWGSVAIVWASVVMIADAGRTGRLERIFAEPIAPGQEISAYPAFERFAGVGWSTREPWGIWSIGAHSVLNLPVPRFFAGRRRLFVKGWLLTTERHPTATVAFSANGVEIGTYAASVTNHNVEATMDLPLKIFDNEPSNLRIDIAVAQPVSPLALGISLDSRELGFALVSMKLLEDNGP